HFILAGEEDETAVLTFSHPHRKLCNVIVTLAIFFTFFIRKSDEDNEADNDNDDLNHNKEYIHSSESSFTYCLQFCNDRLNEGELASARNQRLKEICM
ncbi:unnamed protein product, partial [Adineta steineri]